MDLSRLADLPPEVARELLIIIEQGISYEKLHDYVPYAKQKLFHLLGRMYSQRALIAGNQLGKTVAAGAEWALHLTGRYPDWWDGAVFDKATILWAGGVTGETTRDNPQRILVGPPAIEDLWGTGMIPKDAIVDWDRALGTANLLDNIVVRHGGGGDVQGGRSLLSFKAYEKGREKWQGPTIDGVWFDEEPPEDIYSEGLTRTNNGQRGQFAMATFTPLLGMSNVVRKFLMEPGEYRIAVNMTIDDAEHYSPEERKKIVASYPEHEREARARGIPTLGSGRIFPVAEERIKVPAFAIPAHWPRICGLDFGADHPTAAVWLAWDRDADIVYVTDCHRMSGAGLIATHAQAVKSRGEWIPCSWPHDGLNETAAGPALAKQYAAHGVNMRPENAKFPEDSVNPQRSRISVEAGLADMLERMNKGQWKVFEHLNDWIEEFRLYHRKNGKIVKLNDDAISASRYAYMDLRFAIIKSDDREKVVAEHYLGHTDNAWMGN